MSFGLNVYNNDEIEFGQYLNQADEYLYRATKLDETGFYAVIVN